MKVMDLRFGLVITRRRIKKLPVTELVIHPTGHHKR
jgi:hypothetical protein